MRHDQYETVHHQCAKLRIRIGICQDIGAREEQQDAVGALPSDDVSLIRAMGVVTALCDGMGGMKMGAEAGRMGITGMLGSMIGMPPDQPVHESLLESAKAANAMVYQMALEHGVEGEAGCTLVAAVVKQDKLHWLSVGDSHIYLWHDGQLSQLNEDHVFLMDLLRHAKKGLMSVEEAYEHPEREHLTSYLGTQQIKKIDWNDQPVLLTPGDRVLLCSDGLFKTIPEDAIAACFQEHETEVELRLLEQTLEQHRERQDNISLLVLYCESENQQNDGEEHI